MRRLQDWSARLNECVARAQRAAFEYGTLDCCLYPADAVLAMTGVDPAAAWRGTYNDRAGAERVLAALGGDVGAMLEGMAARHAWAEVPSSEAARGDVIYIPAATLGIDEAMGGFAGVCLGPMASAFIAGHGVAFLPLKHANRGWRID